MKYFIQLMILSNQLMLLLKQIIINRLHKIKKNIQEQNYIIILFFLAILFEIVRDEDAIFSKKKLTKFK